MKLLLQFAVLILLFGSVIPCTASTSLIDHYRKALAADPQNQTLLYHLGVAQLTQGENRQALSSFRAAYSQRSDDPEINFNLALTYSRLGDPDSALLYLDQVLVGDQPEIYPLKNAYFNLVLLYEKLNQLDEAVQLLQRLSAENPTDLEYLRLLGDYQLRLGRVDQAIGSITRYLQQVPEDDEIRDYVFAVIFNRGLAAFEKSDIAGARREFLRTLQFVDSSPPVFYYLALLDYQQDQYQLVADRLPRVYARLSDDLKGSAGSILYNTALSLKQQGDFAAARQALLPLSSSIRPRIKDLALLAGIQLQMGEYAEARQSYLRILQEDPSHGSAANGIQAAEKGAFNEIMDLAAVAFSTNDLLDVRSYLEQAAEIYPENNRLRIFQARLARASKEGWMALQRQAEELEAQQQYAEALVLLRKGLLLASTEPRLLHHEKRLVELLSQRIEDLYRQGREFYARGELQTARVSFEQLIELRPSHQGGMDYLRRINRQLLLEAQHAVRAGEAALARADLLEARHAFRRALDARPLESAAVRGLKQTEQMFTARVSEVLMQSRRARAEGHLSTALELLHEGQQKWPDVRLEKELVRVEEESAQYQRSIVQLAQEAIDTQRFSPAARLLVRIERLNPELAESTGLRREFEAAKSRVVTEQLKLARQEMLNKNFDVGLKAYRRVLDIEPGNAEALAGLTRGRSELEATISQNLAMGIAAHREGKFEQARQAYRKVLDLDPHQPEALLALRQIDRVGRAGLNNIDSKSLYLQGIEFYTEGDYRQAIATWRQVLDLDPANDKARMNIDKAQRKLSQIRERQRG